jgi:hypothetical protein
MPRKLADKPEVLALAQDLGLKPGENPVQDILRHVRKNVRSFLKEVPCERLSDLLRLIATKVDTLIIEVHTEDDLRSIRERYVADREFGFAEIESEFADHYTYGITYRLQAPKPGQRKFVSVIDCRGDKGWRSYFTKWHEIAHLLALTPQQRLKFYRTHAHDHEKDPEESVMDKIAGNIGFFDEIVRKHVKQPISFRAISDLKERLCPEASAQASLLGFFHAWPKACLLVDARLAWRKRDAARIARCLVDIKDAPVAALRAVRVAPNEASRAHGFFIPENMRVPQRSVIFRLNESDEAEMEAEENLSWWTSSDGGRLPAMKIRVVARRTSTGIQALIEAKAGE